MADHCNASATILYFTFTYLLLVIPIAGDSPTPYKPDYQILIDCGFSGNVNGFSDSRTWVGDVNSEYFPSQLLTNNASLALQPETQSSSIAGIPYLTARLSSSQFTYSFRLPTTGQKFIRLYFYAAAYPGFDRSKAFFSVRAGRYTLLRDFNSSVNADASGSDKIFREFYLYVEGNDEKLNITFTPTNQYSYAFINGIEIVSMPVNLYYTPPKPDNQGLRGLKLIGQDNRFFPIENYTALEMVYRINIGGNAISPAGDTGMFRTWSQESLSYLYDLKEDARPVNATITLNFSKIQPYTAPQDVYRTARTMGPNATLNKSYNITWKYPVDPEFYYMLRLHFCEFEGPISAPGERVFLIYIRDLMAEGSADVIQWAGGKGIPYYEDYVVFVSGSKGEKKVDLSVKLQPNPEDWKTACSNVILNAIELFKLNDSNGNLAGPNPFPHPTTTQSLPSSIRESKNLKNRHTTIVVSAVVGGVVFCLVAMFVLALFIFWRGKRHKDLTSNDGTSRWTPFSFSLIKSSRTRSSTLPSNLCRCFSLAEIKAAANDFDDVFIIGVGGFGNVYKGYIDDGATQVAIKRLKPGSKQGAHEFKTEIEFLSQLRHRHLVSLIGFCNDDSEMILVYDYMSHGTLRSHLYGSDKPSIPWKERLQICIGAAEGLHYLHTGAKYTIIHRDVKTTNILLDEKWTAKVSDFGLSRLGPTNMSKAHVSTVVKGSFGYMDPEYYRLQKLTEKSDVYSFGVVLCEVLCGRPAVIRSEDVRQNNLADVVRRCRTNNTMAQIIDTNIKNQISPQCFKRFIELVMSCIQEEGTQRPSMNDVVKGLEFVLQLQESAKEAVDNVGGDDDQNEMNNGEEWLLSDIFDKNASNSVTSSEGSSSANKGFSRFFSTEIMELNAGR